MRWHETVRTEHYLPLAQLRLELEGLLDSEEEMRLLARRSLIILTQDHLRQLLSPTLASLPPFYESRL